MNKLDLSKPKYQASRWTTCCQCHGALDTMGDIAHLKVDSVRRDFHLGCYIRFKASMTPTQPEEYARAGIM